MYIRFGPYLTCTQFIEDPSAYTKTVKHGKSIPIDYLATQCIFCLRKINLRYEHRTKTFHSRGELKNNFERKPQRHMPDSQVMDYPHTKCNERLSHKQHLGRLGNSAYRVIIKWNAPESLRNQGIRENHILLRLVRKPHFEISICSGGRVLRVGVTSVCRRIGRQSDDLSTI